MRGSSLVIIQVTVPYRAFPVATSLACVFDERVFTRSQPFRFVINLVMVPVKE